ncbi:MAG: AbrB/MazE/SpoVT family DNA-binding domain-containing protein [Gemmatimonadota bacterium]
MPPVEVRLEANGRVLLPAEVRHRLGLKPGDTLLLDVTADGILLWTREMAARELQAAVSRALPQNVSLLDELKALRRAEDRSLDVAATVAPTVRRRGKR